MAKAADLLVRIGADISDFQSKFGQLEKGLKSTGDSLKKTGKTMTKRVTAPILALGTGAVVTAANFDKSMNNVAAISGATGDEFEALRDQAKELGSTTMHSASDAADGMTYLAMAGFDVNEIMDAMPSMLDLATASGMDLAQTADIASNILTGFGMEAGESGRMADVLAKAASSANTDVAQMGDAMSYVAPVAHGAGLSMEETAAAIGVLSDAGIQGSRAGTSLRKMISSLQNPTGATKDVLNELGLSMEDVNPATNSLSDILGTLSDAGITSAQAMELVGQEAGPGLIALLKQGEDGLKEFEEDLLNSEGAAADMAETMSGGMYGAFIQLTSALEALAIEFGEVLAPAVMKVAEVITAVVRWFTQLGDTTKLIITIIASLVAAIGPLLIVLGFIMTALSGLSLAMVKVISVISLVVAVVGVLVAAFMHAWETSDQFRDAVLIAWEMIKEGLQQTAEVIKEIFTMLWEFLMEIFDMFMEYWNEYGEELIESVSQIFMNIYETVVEVLNIIWEFIQTILETMGELWDQHGEKVMTLVDTAFGIIWDIIRGIVTGIQEFTAMILQKITSFWSKHGENVMTVISTAFGIVRDIISGIITGIQEFTAMILDKITSFWDKHGETVMTLIDTAFGIVRDIIRGIVTGIQEFTSMVLEKITSFWDKHGDNIMQIIEFAMNFIQQVISSAMSIIQGIMNTVWPVIVGVISGAMSLIQGIMDTVWPIVVGVITGAWNTISGVVEGAVSVVSGLIGALAGILTGDFAAAWDGLKEIVSGVWSAIEGVVRGGINAVIGLINGMIGAVNNISIDIPDWVPKFGGKSFGIDIPKVPQLADGGIASGATLAEIGEGTNPEMVAPLNDATMRPFANLIAKHLLTNQGDGSRDSFKDPLENRPIVLVSPDGRVLAEFVSDDIRKIHDREDKIQKSFEGG